VVNVPVCRLHVRTHGRTKGDWDILVVVRHSWRCNRHVEQRQTFQPMAVQYEMRLNTILERQLGAEVMLRCFEDAAVAMSSTAKVGWALLKSGAQQTTPLEISGWTTLSYPGI